MAGVPFNPLALAAQVAASQTADPAAGAMPMAARPPIIRPDSILGGLLNGPGAPTGGALAAPVAPPMAGAMPAATPVPGQVPMPAPRPETLTDAVPMPVPRPAGLVPEETASPLGEIGKALSGVQAPTAPKADRIDSPRAPAPSQAIQQGGLEALVQAMMSRPQMANSLGAMLGRQ